MSASQKPLINQSLNPTYYTIDQMLAQRLEQLLSSPIIWVPEGHTSI